jgi:hypothetical protein
MPYIIPKLILKGMLYISQLFIIAGLFINPFLYSQNLSPATPPSSKFISPLDIPLLLSGNYGEYRPGHFHAGMDLKTQQVEGKPVFAVDSGYVYRIVVLTGSYGNALYMKHPGGNITLYGHLSKFEPALAKYVEEQQYKKKSFTVDLNPDSGTFVFRKGGLLGLSGNSGGSFGPHLHFEIRDKSGTIPINPLNYGFAIEDKTKPIIRWLWVYPLDAYSTVNGTNQKMLIQVNEKNGIHSIAPDIIEVSGKVGIGIEAYDYLDHSPNACSPYTLSLTVDDNPNFFCRIDSIPFSSAGYLDSYYDYGEMLRSGKKIQKLFIDPNNKLAIYKHALNRGIIQPDDNAAHTIQVVVRDTYGNSSALNFKLKFTRPSNAMLPGENDSLVVATFFYDSLNVYENTDIRVAVPRDALFDNIHFTYAKYSNDSIPYSAVHQVHNEYTPLFKPYILSIKPRGLPASFSSSALIARRESDGSWVSVGGDFKNGFVSARVKVFGQFIVTVDTAPPVIKPLLFNSGGKYVARQVIAFTIADSLSGIRKYAGYIDKKWALFEYDAKNHLLSYTLDDNRLEKDKMHLVELYVTDNKDNVTRFRDSFYY